MEKQESVAIMKDFGVISTPINQKDLVNAAREGNYVQAIIEVEAEEIFALDIEERLDLLSEMLTGDSLLSDINYTVVHPQGIDLKEGYIYIRVSGDPEYAVDEFYGCEQEPVATDEENIRGEL
jgi:hypothetical protein